MPDLSQLLHVRAELAPDRRFLWTAMRSVTYGEAEQTVGELGGALTDIGVMAGDLVAVLMGNSVEHVMMWLALNRIGAISVPVDTVLDEAALRRRLDVLEPRLVVTTTSELAAVARRTARDAETLTYDELATGAHRRRTDDVGTSAPEPARGGELDTAVMLFTSGTTGVPKACMLSHRYLIRQAQLHTEHLGLTADDVLYTPFPMFHIDAVTLTVGAALATGCTAALGVRFSASRFWDEVRASKATVFNFMGATANILWKQTPSVRDHDHRVRLAWGVPMPACEPHWQERFGFPLLEVYGLTDAGLPAYQPIDEPRRAGSCGRVLDEYEVRIGGVDDEPLPPGEVGQILVRSDEPGLLSNGYHGMPEATAAAFRGGWFHTGDLGSLDSDGYLYFAARSSEVIRRRGENIGCSEIEATVDTHPAVLESAAVGVASELSEDDIKIVAAIRPGVVISAAELIEYCRNMLPSFMVPRYVQFTETLPKTPTEKIARHSLRTRPPSGRVWDAEQDTYLDSSTKEYC